MNPVLIIQGTDTYITELTCNYEDDIIFSTWEGQTSGFKNTVYSKKPDNPGYGNSHLQFYGLYKGALRAKEMGHDHVLKIRADFIIEEYQYLLKLIEYRMSFLAYHNYMGGYLIDYIVGGPVDLIIDIMSEDTSNSPDFTERQLFNRIKKRNITEVQYLLPLMKEHNISCHSLKWDRDIVESGLVDKLYTYPHYI